MKLPSPQQNANLQKTGHRPRGKPCHLASRSSLEERLFTYGPSKAAGGAAGLKSSMFELEWPPRSGRRQKFPELDRAEWFGINQAHTKILKGQTVFFDRLLAVIVNS